MKAIAGKVVSTKMKNTIIVEVARQRVHPLYKKIMKKTIRLKAHCEDESVKEGNMVEIISTRPISKEKFFKFVRKVDPDSVGMT
ncbi:30S ribosomal protein S17 [Candidatus Gottesmanbacteria bacterium RIFCSPHIGHO2_02_FULL_39_11]|uniref:30S ribosomal protein S17 n=1 Tax=Candidatus Gottesmanbacteria bacterium RIFCSPHIGHO2_02_FULL_39_11 TaxID=1798382 RepID=A0A1F5ZWM6_9BACT|nr:MAG: 30S ribosomal protein S17 [Candidatus Gottesmanbacteria bacterium RIFCSPHIGHO2_02_FULL_39_11]